jgi:hypothetical protein
LKKTANYSDVTDTFWERSVSRAGNRVAAIAKFFNPDTLLEYRPDISARPHSPTCEEAGSQKRESLQNRSLRAPAAVGPNHVNPREYTKFLEELESDYSITISEAKFYDQFIFSGNASDQAQR